MKQMFRSDPLIIKGNTNWKYEISLFWAYTGHRLKTVIWPSDGERRGKQLFSSAT